jgi:hypothetical protein
VSRSETPDSWLALARQFIGREGGAVHITQPAMVLLERYGYDANAAIYGHFKRGGAEKGARSYLRVGGRRGRRRWPLSTCRNTTRSSSGAGARRTTTPASLP